MQLQLGTMSVAFSVYDGMRRDWRNLAPQLRLPSMEDKGILVFVPDQQYLPQNLWCPKGKLSINQFFFRSSLIDLMLFPGRAKGFLFFLFEARISPWLSAKPLPLFLGYHTSSPSQFSPVRFSLPSLYQQDHFLLQLSSLPKDSPTPWTCSLVSEQTQIFLCWHLQRYINGFTAKKNNK